MAEEPPVVVIDDKTLLYVYGLYMGCRIYTPKINTVNDGGTKYSSNIGRLMGVSPEDNGTLLVEYSRGGAIEKFKNFNGSPQCKLVLRDFFEITDQEMLEIGNLLFKEDWKSVSRMLLIPGSRGVECSADGNDYYLTMFDDFSIDTNVERVNLHYIGQYLLRAEFAIPLIELNGHNLLQTGFAVKI